MMFANYMARLVNQDYTNRVLTIIIVDYYCLVYYYNDFNRDMIIELEGNHLIQYFQKMYA